MADDKLSAYRAKRDPARTPEPEGARDGAAEPGRRRFVVQEHHATRLHWDLRLEHEGTLASWAVPNGIPDDPKRNRKAVRTEDHPLEYLDFHGVIPKGNYGAGTMTIWDRGTYDVEKWRDDEVIAVFHGERLQGRYALIRTGRDGDPKDWLIHRMDPPVDPEAEPMPETLVPMLAKAGHLPPASEADRWAFEIKWDGVRALVFSEPGRIRLLSRNGRDVTGGYPELRPLNRALSHHSAILDGEIVAFDADGRPSFGRLQQRMHVRGESQVRRLAKDHPVVLVLFDLLWLDGHSLMGLPYDERRAWLEALELTGPAWQTPAAHHGDGAALLQATAAQGLEGLIAKRRDSVYEPGRRTTCWIKVKNVNRQEVVIAGWEPGEGRRENRIGALVVGVHDEPGGPLRYAGKVGTGFTEAMLDELRARLEPLRTDERPFGRSGPRKAIWVRPELLAEVEFTEWTSDGMLRHPSFKGLRDDKPADDVVPEDSDAGGAGAAPEAVAPIAQARDLGGDARELTVDGRPVKVSNWSKVLWPRTGFTKGDLVEFYVRMAPTLLPHLEGRPLTLKRYPNGVDGQFFYEKNSPKHRPAWVRTAPISTGRKTIDFTLVEDTATLAWLANLADIELHTSLSRAEAIERPTMMVFDLDPGPGTDLVQCCEIGLVLRGLFDGLGLTTVAKTSGSKGLQVYVPLNRPDVTYDDTKPFSKAIAELLEQQMPELVVSRQTKTLREGKVLVDWSQNDEHKTTVNVYSVRARERPTVSTPVDWDEVAACREAGDPGVLTFDTEQVLARVAERGDLFAPALSVAQRLPAL
ncbi:MAG TPA: DNA ligase D [Capillimicrobium sp.]|nr:DNA ligase D [Capillimicrobium sp.]